MQHLVEQAKHGSVRTKADRPLEETTSLPAPKMLPAMPIEISHSPLKVEVGYERSENDVLFRFRYAKPQPEDHPDIEAFYTRQLFLEIKTPGEALDFLSVTGHFRLRDKEFPKKQETLSWSDFQRWQELIRILMRTGSLSERPLFMNGKNVGIEFAVPEPLRPLMGELSFQETMWLRGVPDGLSIHPVPEPTKHGSRNQLKVQIAVHSTLEAIFAAIYVDTLNGIQYEKCGYCDGLFEIYTRHAREYCSTTCAQKAGVRRRRAQAKSATVKPTSRKAKATTRKVGK